MIGSAGSKYGIIQDDLPLKKHQNSDKLNLDHKGITKVDLKDIRDLINSYWQQKQHHPKSS